MLTLKIYLKALMKRWILDNSMEKGNVFEAFNVLLNYPTCFSPVPPLINNKPENLFQLFFRTPLLLSQFA